MLPKIFDTKYVAVVRFLLIGLPLFYITPAFAQTGSNFPTVSAETMLVNLASQIPQLMQMITAIAYVMGMYFVFYGVLLLKQYGEARSQMSGERHLKGPLIYIIIGAFLLYTPTSVEVGLSTFWTEPNPYGYVENVDQWGEFLNVCFLIIQFIGTLAFIRGLVILSHLSGHGQPGTFGKGLTHIIGGIFCINIYQFVQVILSTLGINA